MSIRSSSSSAVVTMGLGMTATSHAIVVDAEGEEGTFYGYSGGKRRVAHFVAFARPKSCLGLTDLSLWHVAGVLGGANLYVYESIDSEKRKEIESCYAIVFEYHAI